MINRWVAIVVGLGLLASPARPAPPRFLEDATLRAVQFVDAQEGWAVGDDGAIWHSIDGGATWEAQASGTRASLRAVHFLTPYCGWIVGRQEFAEGRSVGVVLATTDGGLHWHALAVNTLPGLNCVQFFTERDGVAAGDGADGAPSGLFRTTDGGRTWKPVAGPRNATWQGIQFTDPETGILAGPWGKLAVLRNGAFAPAQVDSLGQRGVRAVKFSGAGAFAVGQGGLVLRSSQSAGVRWGFVETRLPEAVAASLDWHGLAASQGHLWLCGRPGSVILHSPDQGETWERLATGQRLPLHAIQFLNPLQGWAVGEMGVILATQDGGKTWKSARSPAPRAAAMLVQATPATVPLEAAARLGVSEGYRLVGCSVVAPELSASALVDATEADRFAVAFRAAGGTAVDPLWQFPRSHAARGSAAADQLRAWDRLHGDGKAREALLRQMVLAIRIWQPQLILTDRVDDPDPLQQLLLPAWVEAFKLAGESDQFPEQLEPLGLAPHAVWKIYGMQSTPAPASVLLVMEGVEPLLENLPADFVASAQRILDPARTPCRMIPYQLLGARLKGATTHQSLLEGLDQTPGSASRRTLPGATPLDIERFQALQRFAQSREVLLKLSDPANTPLAQPEQTMAQVDRILREMPLEMGVAAADQLARGYARAGRWHLARETYFRLLDRYPGHPLALDAARWLIRFHTSSENRRREELANFLAESTTTLSGVPGFEERGGVKVNGGTGGVSERRAFREIDRSKDLKVWLEGSLKLEETLFAHGPLMARDPSIQLCMQSARRQLGKLDDVKKWSSAYLAETASLTGDAKNVPGADPWRDCVLTESWLLNRSSALNTPKPLSLCRQTHDRPRLDGVLDDACWAAAKPLPLKSPSGLDPAYAMSDTPPEAFQSFRRKPSDPPAAQTQAVFTYDDEYLYIAVQCLHPAGQQQPKLPVRSRDMDLERFDRVSILIDLDRDYQTYYRFQIDARGALAEDCWGDRTWNPKWLVATRQEALGWTAEVAIPMVELCGDAPPPGRVWAVNVTRVLPGRGVQSWSTPADVSPRPEGMGLLQFAGEAK